MGALVPLKWFRYNSASLPAPASALRSRPATRDDFVRRLFDALLSARNEFQEVQEIALRFVPEKRFRRVSGRLESEALFLSIAAFSLQTPAAFGFGRPLYTDEHYHSVLSLQMGLAAENLCAVKKDETGPLTRFLFKRQRQRLVKKICERSIVYYYLKLIETDIPFYPISAEKRIQHSELLCLPTIREFLGACSGADASLGLFSPGRGRSRTGRLKDVVKRSLLIQMQVALINTQFAIQDNLKTSGLTQ